MVNQYPDSIVVTVQTATQDSNGNWVNGSSTSYTFSCRAEANSAGRKLTGIDGVTMDFAFTCFMSPTTTVIPNGSPFTLTTLNNGTITGNVKRQHNGQLNSKLWV
jgi:hypothetical protein